MLVRQPSGSVHHSSCPVIIVPHGVQKEESNRIAAAGVGLIHTVSVTPVSRSCRCTPAVFSNTVNRKRPLWAPPSFDVIMSHAPLLGMPIASCVLRSAMDCCANAGLLSVIGEDSSAVGPAELVSGVKSEKRGPPAARFPAVSAASAPAKVPTMAK